MSQGCDTTTTPSFSSQKDYSIRGYKGPDIMQISCDALDILRNQYVKWELSNEVYDVSVAQVGLEIQAVKVELLKNELM